MREGCGCRGVWDVPLGRGGVGLIGVKLMQVWGWCGCGIDVGVGWWIRRGCG